MYQYLFLRIGKSLPVFWYGIANQESLAVPTSSQRTFDQLILSSRGTYIRYQLGIQIIKSFINWGHIGGVIQKIRILWFLQMCGTPSGAARDRDIEDIPGKRRTRWNAEFLKFLPTPITMKNSNHNQLINKAITDLRL